MGEIGHIITVAIGCSIKPLIAIPAARVAKIGHFETFIGACIGGCIGIVVFFLVIEYIAKIIHDRKIKRLKENAAPVARTKKIFTKRNRFIIKSVNKYGLMGIAAIAPLLSLPLAALIASRINDKFIHNKKKVVVYLCTSVIVWSFIMVSITRLF